MKRRTLALFAPPVLALLGAAVYTGHRVDEASRAVADFCAAVTVGLPAREFAARALAGGLEVHDGGAASTTLVASRRVYGWREQVFACRAERDADGRVLGGRLVGAD